MNFKFYDFKYKLSAFKSSTFYTAKQAQQKQIMF